VAAEGESCRIPFQQHPGRHLTDKNGDMGARRQNNKILLYKKMCRALQAGLWGSLSPGKASLQVEAEAMPGRKTRTPRDSLTPNALACKE